MTTVTTSAGSTISDGPAMVDPRAPRFGQTLTTLGLLAGVVLGTPELVAGVAAVLVTAVVSRWRVDLWGILWRRLAIPAVGRPEKREPASPHRFAKLLGATGTAGATLAFAAGVPVVGYALAGGVAVAAGLAAVTGICLGCRMYRGVSLFRRLDVV